VTVVVASTSAAASATQHKHQPSEQYPMPLSALYMCQFELAMVARRRRPLEEEEVVHHVTICLGSRSGARAC
jgi:hypothetical protein